MHWSHCARVRWELPLVAVIASHVVTGRYVPTARTAPGSAPRSVRWASARDDGGMHTPVGGGGEMHTPIGGGGEMRTPIGGGGEMRTPIGSGGEMRTDMGGVSPERGREVPPAARSERGAGGGDEEMDSRIDGGDEEMRSRIDGSDGELHSRIDGSDGATHARVDGDVVARLPAYVIDPMAVYAHPPGGAECAPAPPPDASAWWTRGAAAEDEEVPMLLEDAPAPAPAPFDLDAWRAELVGVCEETLRLAAGGARSARAFGGSALVWEATGHIHAAAGYDSWALDALGRAAELCGRAPPPPRLHVATAKCLARLGRTAEVCVRIRISRMRRPLEMHFPYAGGGGSGGGRGERPRGRMVSECG